MPSADSSQRARWTRPGPVTAAILIMTALGLALRLYQLSRPDYLIGVTEYDDGTDFGSAILLIHGDLPYRDFIMVQPPGITLLMAPVALVTKGFGTAWGMGVGRILTALAGAAAVAMGGLLVRHRGLLAVIVTGGILAVYPAAVQAAHTVLLEPWLVLFCLAGMLAVFDGDGLASTRRLVWGGVAFGFAGAIKVWAILPVLVIVVLILAARQPRRALAYAAGVVAGFVVPVLPFAALAPGTFYRSVIVAQLVRVDSVRIPLGYRLHEMTGLTDATGLTSTLALSLISLLILALVVGCSVAASRLAGERPPLLEQFALAASALTIIAFLWPADSTTTTPASWCRSWPWPSRCPWPALWTPSARRGPRPPAVRRPPRAARRPGWSSATRRRPPSWPSPPWASPSSCSRAACSPPSRRPPRG